MNAVKDAVCRRRRTPSSWPHHFSASSQSRKAMRMACRPKRGRLIWDRLACRVAGSARRWWRRGSARSGGGSSGTMAAAAAPASLRPLLLLTV